MYLWLLLDGILSIDLLACMYSTEKYFDASGTHSTMGAMAGRPVTRLSRHQRILRIPVFSSFSFFFFSFYFTFFFLLF